MKEKKYNNGDYIYLNWDGNPDAYYVKGHVENYTGLVILEDAGALDNGELDNIGVGQHLYARWSMEPGEDGNQHFLRTYKTPGRGRFKITEYGVGIFAVKENKK